MHRMTFAFFSIAVFLQFYTLSNVGAASIPEDAYSIVYGKDKGKRFHAIAFLNNYGYRLKISGNTLSMVKAIKSFQAFNGLPVTGDLDNETLKKMKSPRCGVPDKTRVGVLQTSRGKWTKTTLTWKVTKWSEKLDRKKQRMAFSKAFNLWAKVTPLNFKYTNSNPDIEISFLKGDHGDGFYNNFDGPGGVLAHAYPPGEGDGGNVHFDADENWKIGKGKGVDLITIAAHEFGHALGLEHSSVPGSLMTSYPVVLKKLKLHPDDIRKIQSLYGVRTSTMTQRRKFCQRKFRLDAFAQGGDGFMYVFSRKRVYQVGGKGLQADYPKNIIDVFAGGPKGRIVAASFAPENNKFYMFTKKNQGLRVWRFSNIATRKNGRSRKKAVFRLDRGYPKRINTDRNNFKKASAAFTRISNGKSQIYIFSGRFIWRWNIRSERIGRKPKRSRRFFRQPPKYPDAAFMNNQGNVLFFKKNKYTFLQDRKTEGKAKPYKPFGPDLFGAACGGDPTIFQFAN